MARTNWSGGERWVCILIVSCMSAAAAAQDIASPEDIDTGLIESGDTWTETPIDEKRITGLIADQTMTRIGRAFMQSFSATWRELRVSPEISVAVYERASARWGSLIWVEQNFRRLYQVVLLPGRGDPGAAGEAAARWVRQRSADMEAERLLFKDPDIASDEF